MKTDLNRFLAHMQLKGILGKLGLVSVRHKKHDGVLRTSDIEDATAYAVQAHGNSSQIMMSQHTYDVMVKVLRDKK